jgi:TolB-like protein
MKKRQLIWFSIILFLVAGSIFTGNGCLYAQNIVTLDESIKVGAGEIEAKLKQGVKVVVLNFNSSSKRFSDYVLDELMTVLVRNGKLIVVDRANLELIQKEMNFQMSGEVSDKSAQQIGQKLGAQSIISGSIEDLGSFYRIRFRTIEVVSAAIQVLSSINVRKDNQIATLMSNQGNKQNANQNNNTVSSTEYPNGLNFSTGRKVGAGFLNWIYGLGSFTMGDWVGGLIVGGIELAGIFLIASSINDMAELSPEDEYDPTSLILGYGLQIGGVIYGHIRPFSYDKSLAKKNGTYFAFDEANPIYHISVMPVPTQSSLGLSVVYSASF